MLQWEHSAILSTFIKLPFVIKICVLSIFEWPLKTGFTVVISCVKDLLVVHIAVNTKTDCCCCYRTPCCRQHPGRLKKKTAEYNHAHEILVLLTHARIQRGWEDRGSRPPPPLKNHKNIGFLSNTGPDPLHFSKLPSQHLMLGHHLHASETPLILSPLKYVAELDPL